MRCLTKSKTKTRKVLQDKLDELEMFGGVEGHATKEIQGEWQALKFALDKLQKDR